MCQDNGNNDCKEIRPSVSQGGAPEFEDDMLEDEIGGLFDELIQEREKK